MKQKRDFDAYNIDKIPISLHLHSTTNRQLPPAPEGLPSFIICFQQACRYRYRPPPYFCVYNLPWNSSLLTIKTQIKDTYVYLLTLLSSRYLKTTDKLMACLLVMASPATRGCAVVGEGVSSGSLTGCRCHVA